MKYFTPELYVRGQSEDPAVFDEVERGWDEGCDRSAAHPQRDEDVDVRYFATTAAAVATGAGGGDPMNTSP